MQKTYKTSESVRKATTKYNRANKDAINAKCKQYYELHKETLKRRRLERYKNKKEQNKKVMLKEFLNNHLIKKLYLRKILLL